MNHRCKTGNIFLVLFALLFVVTTSSCLAAGVKERMLARLPEINALKQQGIIGENNKGFLEYRTDGQIKKTLIEAENADRLKVYEAIARKQGATVALVGARRARQIARKAPAGTWLQDESGRWYRK